MRPSPWKATFQVASKELRSSFRDRQTVLYTIVLPIALYPAVLWCLVQGSLLVQGRDERTAVRVGLAAEVPGELPGHLQTALEEPDALRGLPDSAAEPLGVDHGNLALDESGAAAWLRHRGSPDAVLWIPNGAGAPGQTGARARVFFDGTERNSKIARSRVEERLTPYAERLRRAAVVNRGQSPEALVPFEVELSNVAPKKDMLAYLLSFLLPMLLVVMCVMGAFFPAVDLTAGEKERSTAETTMLLPVPRLAVHQGKILAVCASAVLATALNLGALGLSFGHLLGMLSEGGVPPLQGFPILALLAVAPLALLFSFFVSAVLTGLATLAKSFEDGQALLGPVQILFIVPAIVGVVPGIELSLPLCFVPVANVALAFRSMLLGQVLPGEYALVALSLLLYGLLAMRLAVHLLSRESLLAGSFSPRTSHV
jgi:sodium transport system permease protein